MFRRIPFTGMLVLLCGVTVAHAGARTLWSSDNGTAPAALLIPLKVQAITPNRIQLLDHTGDVGEPLSVVAPGAGSLPTAVSKAENAGSPKPTDVGHFTGDGSLAVFEPRSEREQPYIYAFDPSRRKFIGSATDLAGVVQWVVGPHGVAALMEKGARREQRGRVPDALYLRVFERRGDVCEAFTRWSSTSYTGTIAINVNSHGDVVALVGKLASYKVWTSVHVVIARRNGEVIEREVAGISESSKISVSEDGTLVALTLGSRVTTLRVSNVVREESSIDFGTCGGVVNILHVSISDGSAVVAIAVTQDRRIAVTCGGPGTPCQLVNTYDGDEGATLDARFYSGNDFYIVLTTLDPAKSALAILRYE